MTILGPRNKVGAQLHDSLGPASNLQKIFCAHIGNYTQNFESSQFLKSFSQLSPLRSNKFHNLLIHQEKLRFVRILIKDCRNLFFSHNFHLRGQGIYIYEYLKKKTHPSKFNDNTFKELNKT